MATIFYSALASINNELCQDGKRGYITLPFLPLLFGFLNPIVIGLILLTAVLLRYTGSTNWQNSSKGERSFQRTFWFVCLDFYVIILLLFFMYKIFFCKKTLAYSKLYSAVSDASQNESAQIAGQLVKLL